MSDKKDCKEPNYYIDLDKMIAKEGYHYYFDFAKNCLVRVGGDPSMNPKIGDAEICTAVPGEYFQGRRIEVVGFGNKKYNEVYYHWEGRKNQG